MPGGDDHQSLLEQAIALESVGQRMLLDGDPQRARGRFHEAAETYQRSWEAAPPTAYGRLVGLLKASVLSGSATAEAAYVRTIDLPTSSPVACYAMAIAALVARDDRTARTMAQRMRTADDSFRRAAAGIAAIADGDADRLADAVRAIVDDFAARDEHLTGVPIADTAVMLVRLAAERGLKVAVESPLLPR